MLASMANSARSMEAAARAFERRFGRTMPADLTDSEEEDQTEFYTRTFTNSTFREGETGHNKTKKYGGEEYTDYTPIKDEEFDIVRNEVSNHHHLLNTTTNSTTISSTTNPSPQGGTNVAAAPHVAPLGPTLHLKPTEEKSEPTEEKIEVTITTTIPPIIKDTIERTTINPTMQERQEDDEPYNNYQSHHGQAAFPPDFDYETSLERGRDASDPDLPPHYILR